MLDGGVELVTPAKATGLAGSPGDTASDQAPIPSPKLTDELAKNGVLLRRPRTFDSIAVSSLSAAAPRLMNLDLVVGAAGDSDGDLVADGGGFNQRGAVFHCSLSLEIGDWRLEIGD